MAIEARAEQSRSHGSVSVRVNGATHDRLVELAREQNLSIARVLARSVDTYDRMSMAQESDAAYARLRQDPAAWDEWQAELQLWDATLLDGVAGDE
jgi:hypothetical protein